MVKTDFLYQTLGPLSIMCSVIKLDPYFILNAKINSLHVKNETQKYQKETWENLGIGKPFLIMTENSESVTKEIDTFSHIKNKQTSRGKSSIK